MRTETIAGLLILVLLLSSCGMFGGEQAAAPTVTPVPEATPTMEPPTPTPEPVPTATPPPSPTPADDDVLELDVNASSASVEPGGTVQVTLAVENSSAGSTAADVTLTGLVSSTLVISAVTTVPESLVEQTPASTGDGTQVSAFAPTAMGPGDTLAMDITFEVPADAPAGDVGTLWQVYATAPNDDTANNTGRTVLTIQMPDVAAAAPAAPAGMGGGAPPPGTAPLPGTSTGYEALGITTLQTVGWLLIVGLLIVGLGLGGWRLQVARQRARLNDVTRGGRR